MRRFSLIHSWRRSALLGLLLLCTLWFVLRRPSPTVPQFSISQLAGFDLNQIDATDDDIPERLRILDGKTVVITGQMYAPNTDADQLNDFSLTEIRNEHHVPMVQDFVRCHTVKPTRNFNGAWIRAKGVLHVHIEKGVDRLKTIYQMDVAAVQPVP